MLTSTTPLCSYLLGALNSTGISGRLEEKTGSPASCMSNCIEGDQQHFYVESAFTATFRGEASIFIVSEPP